MRRCVFGQFNPFTAPQVCNFKTVEEQAKVTTRSIPQQLSFELSHIRISLTESGVTATIYSKITSTTGKYCSVALIHLNGCTIGFHPLAQKLEPPCTAQLTAPQESTAR